MQEPIFQHPPHVEKDPTPVFLFVCKDGPNAASLRVAHLAGHLTCESASKAGPHHRAGKLLARLKKDHLGRGPKRCRLYDKSRSKIALDQLLGQS